MGSTGHRFGLLEFCTHMGHELAGTRYWDRRFSTLASGHGGLDLLELRTASGLLVKASRTELLPVYGLDGSWVFLRASPKIVSSAMTQLAHRKIGSNLLLLRLPLSLSLSLSQTPSISDSPSLSQYDIAVHDFGLECTLLFLYPLTDPALGADSRHDFTKEPTRILPDIIQKNILVRV